MSRHAVTPAEYRALAKFRYELRRFLRFSEQAARAAGLEPQQHQLLLAVRGMPPRAPATNGGLGERLQLRHHSTVEVVDRMEARGLVRRARQGHDRRWVAVRRVPCNGWRPGRGGGREVAIRRGPDRGDFMAAWRVIAYRMAVLPLRLALPWTGARRPPERPQVGP